MTDLLQLWQAAGAPWVEGMRVFAVMADGGIAPDAGQILHAEPPGLIVYWPELDDGRGSDQWRRKVRAHTDEHLALSFTDPKTLAALHYTLLPERYPNATISMYHDPRAKFAMLTIETDDTDGEGKRLRWEARGDTAQAEVLLKALTPLPPVVA